MLSIILGAITGLSGPIRDIITKISDLKIAQVQASTDQERIHTQAQIDEAHDRMSVLVAEAGSRVNAAMRFLLALGPMLFLNKVFIFDKVLGSLLGHSRDGQIWSTDPLDSNLWAVVTAMLSFYFLYDMAASWRRK